MSVSEVLASLLVKRPVGFQHSISLNLFICRTSFFHGSTDSCPVDILVHTAVSGVIMTRSTIILPPFFILIMV